jgi:hypothetical protein
MQMAWPSTAHFIGIHQLRRQIDLLPKPARDPQLFEIGRFSALRCGATGLPRVGTNLE